MREYLLRRLAVIGMAGFMLGLCGCGSSKEFPIAPVHGNVTCNGKPLTGGTVVFSPIGTGPGTISGKPAAGAIGPDGKFTLTTSQAGDGAIVGKHSVSVLPPEAKDEAKLPTIPCSDATVEVEVKAGEQNQIVVELSGK